MSEQKLYIKHMACVEEESSSPRKGRKSVGSDGECEQQKLDWKT